MMSNREINDSTVGGIILLIFLLVMHLLKGVFALPQADRGPDCEAVFVKISGDVTRPGVYGFCQPPDLKALLTRAGNLPAEGGIIPDIQKDLSGEGIQFHSGADVEVLSNGTEIQVFEGVMSAFNKSTLGIPISLNYETMEGLTAVPGIGPKIAGSIVRLRDTRGGFQELEELFSVPGIGPTLYRKITPYLVL